VVARLKIVPQLVLQLRKLTPEHWARVKARCLKKKDKP